MREVKKNGRNELEEKRKREEEKEKKEREREAGCRPNYCLLLNATVCSDQKKN